MDDREKQVILREIEYWQKHHLLPEHYCRFLINLYTEGDQKSRKNKASRRIAPCLRTVLFALVLIVISYIIFHFTRFSFQMQLLLFLLPTMAAYGLGFFYRRHHPAVTTVWLGTASVLLFAGGILILKGWDASPQQQTLFIFLCGLIWWGTGVLAQRHFLLICGLFGILLTFGLYIHPYWLQNGTWWFGQVVWFIPLFFLFSAAAYGVYTGSSRTYYHLGFAALCLAAPEIQGLYVPPANTYWIQVVFLLKFIAASVFWVAILRSKRKQKNATIEL